MCEPTLMVGCVDVGVGVGTGCHSTFFSLTHSRALVFGETIIYMWCVQSALQCKTHKPDIV